MATAIVAYLVVGLLIGLVIRLAGGEVVGLAGSVGAGGAGGLIGGVVANLLFSDGVELDIAGWLGSIVLAIVVVLVLRVARRSEGEGTPPG
ncbi:MAG: hypothetical protein ACLFWM_01920 [Actinomycetota bacterium]